MAKARILIVEDERMVAEVLQLSLEDMGYTVTSVVGTGEMAIRKAEDTRPDLILMDIVLKGKMDGIEAANQIRSRSDIPVVYITAFSDENILERARITEPYGYVIKPFKEKDLQINIEIALYRHKMETKLKESQQWLAAVIRSIGDAVIATDPEGIIKFMNPIAEALTGWKQEDALGKKLTTVLKIISKGMNKQVENPVAKAIREGIFFGLAEHTVLAANNGIEIPVDIIGSSIKDNKGSIIGIVMVFYDIIDRKRIENELLFFEKNGNRANE
ncbi:Chemotaxis response regulator protein-glutamate methylesterase/glutamine deamidase [uncultured archaeon]|nr:Chemotaxis response regulator protein-glutamate methylesterase/glutamine deamidase [uncultured archaeon]